MRRVIACVAAATVLTFAWVWMPEGNLAEPPELRRADRPSPLPDGDRLPIREPAPLAAVNPSFRYLFTDEVTQQPVTYDRCRPLYYVMRPDGAPVGAEELVAEAMAALTSATGLPG